MKEHSFYQFALTARGRKDSKGDLAEEIFNDLSFPKHEKDFNQLSDYIEMQSDITLP
ncbi:YozE family protein, partial [Staphylococcus borealis]